LTTPAGSRPAPRVLVIGLDAADRELIEQWEHQGLLPTISKMKSSGTWASLQTTAEIVHVSAWPSIFTGTTPDKHGLYHAYVMQPGQQAPVRPRPDLCPVPFLWKTLDEHGKRCIVMDAFLTCPLQNFGGIQIVDWGTWTWFWQQTILPASLGKQIAERFGPYPAEDHSKVGMTPPPDPKGFHDRLLAAVARKTAVTKWLLTTQEWDFFLVVFGESHPAGHYFWHFHDPDYVAHSPADSVQMRNALRDVYVALDGAIGEILRVAGEDTLVCLVSGDGMGPNYSASHMLSPLLERMRLLNEPSGDATAANATQNKPAQGRRDLLATLRGLIPKPVRAAISRRLLPRSVNEKLSMRWKTARIAWDRTRAFPIENANEGYIRINLQGREPEGTVQPGTDYHALCDALVETARAMVNPVDGRRAAHAVHKTHEIFNGPCRDQMPDVIINWDPDARVTTRLYSERWGKLESEHAGYAVTPYYTGNHRPNAFMAVVGPGVGPGLVLEGASILDLAPTVLARFGLTAPAHMDGRVLDELTATETVQPHS
jgi:predicted AlkP superfamily phosphohydrolase/phosphomutase